MDENLDNLNLALPGSLRSHNGQWSIACGKCSSCNSVIFPKPPICPHCLCEDIGEHLVRDGGKLYTYTTVHAVRAGWSSPYILGYVDFPEGVRICGPIDVPADSVLAMNADVEVAMGPLRQNSEGETVFSHRFRVESRRSVDGEQG